MTPGSSPLAPPGLLTLGAYHSEREAHRAADPPATGGGVTAQVNLLVGCVFVGLLLQQALTGHRMLGSMGRVGSAGDNAAMESFFSLLQ